jgi:type IV pilus assembly protein PilE
VIKIKGNQGFTLIEVMITAAIVAILASIAIPSYMDSVTKSRRKDAQGALEGFANAMERHFNSVNSYCDAADTTTGVAVTGCGDATTQDSGKPWNRIYSDKSPVDGNDTFYNLTINAVSPSTYTLRATPVGPQANNGILQLTNIGGRSWDKDNNGTISTSENTWE